MIKTIKNSETRTIRKVEENRKIGNPPLFRVIKSYEKPKALSYFVFIFLIGDQAE